MNLGILRYLIAYCMTAPLVVMLAGCTATAQSDGEKAAHSGAPASAAQAPVSEVQPNGDDDFGEVIPGEFAEVGFPEEVFRIIKAKDFDAYVRLYAEQRTLARLFPRDADKFKPRTETARKEWDKLWASALKAGVDLAQAELFTVKLKPQGSKGGGPPMSVAYIIIAHGGKHYRIKLDEMLNVNGRWLLAEDVRWMGETQP